MTTLVFAYRHIEIIHEVEEQAHLHRGAFNRVKPCNIELIVNNLCFRDVFEGPGLCKNIRIGCAGVQDCALAMPCEVLAALRVSAQREMRVDGVGAEVDEPFKFVPVLETLKWQSIWLAIHLPIHGQASLGKVNRGPWHFGDPSQRVVIYRVQRHKRTFREERT